MAEAPSWQAGSQTQRTCRRLKELHSLPEVEFVWLLPSPLRAGSQLQHHTQGVDLPRHRAVGGVCSSGCEGLLVGGPTIKSDATRLPPRTCQVLNNCVAQLCSCGVWLLLQRQEWDGRQRVR